MKEIKNIVVMLVGSAHIERGKKADSWIFVTLRCGDGGSDSHKRYVARASIDIGEQQALRLAGTGLIKSVAGMSGSHPGLTLKGTVTE